jgi:hypothetical protein
VVAEEAEAERQQVQLLNLAVLHHKDFLAEQNLGMFLVVLEEEAWVLLELIHPQQLMLLVLEVLDFHTTHLEQVLFILVVAEAERIAELLLELAELVEEVLGQLGLLQRQMELRILEEEVVVVLLCLELAIHLETADLELSS